MALGRASSASGLTIRHSRNHPKLRRTGKRALRLLRDEGLLEFQRGRGITVAGSPERGAVISRALELIDFARHHGFRRDEPVNLIRTLP
jgi:DNA-binding transcriptional regulator YhcF (GntR family)